MDDLINRQDAIDALNALNCCGYVEEAFERLVEKVMSVPSAHQWIPVSERLPEKDGDYLVFAKWDIEEDYNVQIIPFDSCVEQFGYLHEYFEMHTLGSLGSEFEPVEVKAWMPLPEPYKENTNE